MMQQQLLLPLAQEAATAMQQLQQRMCGNQWQAGEAAGAVRLALGQLQRLIAYLHMLLLKLLGRRLPLVLLLLLLVQYCRPAARSNNCCSRRDTSRFLGMPMRYSRGSSSSNRLQHSRHSRRRCIRHGVRTGKVA
jgi:hypothetical protein